MFQPQPTPFAASCFATPSYGLGATHDIGFLFPPGAGGTGLGGTGGPGGLGGSCSRYASQPSSSPSTGSPSLAQQRIDEQQRQQQQQHHQHQAAQQQIHLQQQQHHQRQINTHLHQPRHPHRQSSDALIKMDGQDQNPHTLAAQQAAAQDYQPVLEGPLVGDRTPSEVITHEYAKADQTYVEKTIALPQTYSHYRPIQGDGNCGWRAIGFSYFEKLIETGDQDQIEGEVARLMSLRHMLVNIGGYSYFEDWEDEAIGLLRDLAANVSNPAVAHILLLQRWNDKSVEGSLIYYFRLLAATYLKAHAVTYDPFVPDGLGIQTYCSQSIELVNREIEHLGIIGLSNILLKPIDFVLEIAYLDRSPGNQVNRYRFPEEANSQDVATLGPMIHLLYRPDHYDILYLTPPPSPSARMPVALPVNPITMQVNRVSSFSTNTAISSSHSNLGTFATADFSALAMIPGFNPTGISGISPLASPPLSAASPVTESFVPSQQHSPWLSHFPDGLPAQSSPQASHPPPIIAAQPPPPPTPSTPMTPSPSMAGASVLGGPHTATAAAMVQNSGLAPSSGYHIRFSPVQLEYEECKSNFPEPTFQVTTNTFKNSVWNRAHYGNPDFHPEEWTPEDDHVDGRIGGRRKSRKDS